jgi:hypothetical protein
MGNTMQIEDAVAELLREKGLKVSQDAGIMIVEHDNCACIVTISDLNVIIAMVEKFGNPVSGVRYACLSDPLMVEKIIESINQLASG